MIYKKDKLTELDEFQIALFSFVFLEFLGFFFFLTENKVENFMFPV